MILWFGKKKKKKELEEAGTEMQAPELSADELAAREAAEKEEAERKAADQAEIERKVAEANRAWEERQQREREAAEAERQRLADEARKTEEAREAARKTAEEARQKAEADEAARQAAEEAEAEARRLEEEAERVRREEAERVAAQQKAEAELRLLEERRRAEAAREEEARHKAAAAAAEPDPYTEVKSPGFFSKLTSGLSKSSSKLGASLTGAFNKRKLDDDALEELEDLLITSDMGARVAAKITSNLAKTRFDKDVTDQEIKEALAEEIEAIMAPREQVVDFSDGPTPRVVLFVGVNGSGKTTTIGKIASKLKEQGAKAVLVAGDTFRAAAIEQLTVWGERAGIHVMSKPTGADAAGLVYEAIEKAKADNLDLVLVDTAGRLQNKAELMSELAKIVRVARKLDPEAPHDVILVLDATVGQNALSQVEAFRHTAEVSGIVMTKLDGTAKGGVLVAIAEAHDLPIHFVGVGEKAEDLQPFSAAAFAKALVGMDEKEPA